MIGPYIARRSSRPVEFACSKFGGYKNFKIIDIVTLVVLYSKSGGRSGIGNKKMSRSLLAALSSSLAWNAFLI
jgi:hypothetical protein